MPIFHCPSCRKRNYGDPPACERCGTPNPRGERVKRRTLILSIDIPSTAGPEYEVAVTIDGRPAPHTGVELTGAEKGAA